MWFAVNSPSSIPWNPKKRNPNQMENQILRILWSIVSTNTNCCLYNTSKYFYVASPCRRGDLWECKNWWSPEDFTSSSLMGVEVFPPFSTPLQHSLGISSQYQFVVKLSSSRLNANETYTYIFGCKTFTHLCMHKICDNIG